MCVQNEEINVNTEKISDELFDNIKDLLDIVSPNYGIVEVTEKGYNHVIDIIKEQL